MRQIIFILLMLSALMLVGTIGFRLTAELPWIESLYLAVVTLTTVGSRDAAHTDAGMLFVVFYLIGGLGIATYSVFELGHWVVGNELRSLLENRRMKIAVERMRDHYIVCGCGRMGRTICHYLQDRGKPFVVIEIDEEKIKAHSEEHDWLVILGDATDDEILERAGIRTAQSLATVLHSDADNVYVALAARMLNSSLQIIARASEDQAVNKLERAGADRVISPIHSGATRMARFMLNPSIDDFLEITDSRESDLELADIIVSSKSSYVGKRLKDIDLRSRGIMVIGIRRADGERLMPPPGDTEIQAGDCLFAFGTSTALNSMIEAK